MSPTFEKDWIRLREGDRVDLYLKGADEPYWDDVRISYVDERGKFIKVWSDQGGHPRDSLARETYEVVRL
jgi:hypothetical protein